jgi:hypothetical protein
VEDKISFLTVFALWKEHEIWNHADVGLIFTSPTSKVLILGNVLKLLKKRFLAVLGFEFRTSLSPGTSSLG